MAIKDRKREEKGQRIKIKNVWFKGEKRPYK